MRRCLTAVAAALALILSPSVAATAADAAGAQVVHRDECFDLFGILCVDEILVTQLVNTPSGDYMVFAENHGTVTATAVGQAPVTDTFRTTQHLFFLKGTPQVALQIGLGTIDFGGGQSCSISTQYHWVSGEWQFDRYEIVCTG